ncbi:MAG: hypothetical protein B7Z61_13530 [Acidobacteria bacterium 37-71-11]|nr:MAG: hypothetical protein B7Z61_13530 [Acidobacteria bacterium 37-71-11]
MQCMPRLFQPVTVHPVVADQPGCAATMPKVKISAAVNTECLLIAPPLPVHFVVQCDHIAIL